MFPINFSCLILTHNLCPFNSLLIGSVMHSMLPLNAFITGNKTGQHTVDPLNFNVEHQGEAWKGVEEGIYEVSLKYEISAESLVNYIIDRQFIV